MKALIQQALNSANTQVEKQVPKTKKTTKSVSIADVLPLDLPKFMSDNNIPQTAYFDGQDNGYDAWDDILLSWEVIIPMTEKDKLEYRKRVFSTIAYRSVYGLLTANGYKRVGYNTGLLKPFADQTIYEMYINSDWDRLVSYYELSFQLIQ